MWPFEETPDGEETMLPVRVVIVKILGMPTAPHRTAGLVRITTLLLQLPLALLDDQCHLFHPLDWLFGNIFITY